MKSTAAQQASHSEAGVSAVKCTMFIKPSNIISPIQAKPTFFYYYIDIIDKHLSHVGPNCDGYGNVCIIVIFPKFDLRAVIREPGFPCSAATYISMDVLRITSEVC